MLKQLLRLEIAYALSSYEKIDTNATHILQSFDSATNSLQPQHNNMLNNKQSFSNSQILPLAQTHNISLYYYFTFSDSYSLFSGIILTFINWVLKSFLALHERINNSRNMI